MARGKSKRGGAAEHENEERWLLTYADMITLLMALFMVLFSISSVNISKYITLQESLKAAFSGSILPGGRSIMQSGSESTAAHTPATSEVPAIVPITPNVPRPEDQGTNQLYGAIKQADEQTHTQLSYSAAQLAQAMSSAQAASAEQSEFQSLQWRIQQYIKAHSLGQTVSVTITRRGLVVNVLTDKLLFASGSATLKNEGEPLLTEVANLINLDHTHPVVVEGYTDNEPINTPQFSSNWQLSTGRATSVVQYLIAHGVDENRLGAAGYADLHPVASNATAAGRALNRRVEIVFERLNPYQSSP